MGKRFMTRIPRGVGRGVDGAVISAIGNPLCDADSPAAGASQATSGDDARNGDTSGSVSPRAVRVATRADGSTMVRPEGWEYAIRMVAGGPEHLAPVRASGSAGDVQIGAREGESG